MTAFFVFPTLLLAVRLGLLADWSGLVVFWLFVLLLRFGVILCFRLFLTKNLLLCLQVFTSSFLLFRVARLGLQMMMYFSRMHRLHLLLVLEYGFAWPMMDHSTLYSWFSSLSCQMCLLSSVAFLLLGLLNEVLWLLYLVLNSVSVSQTYVSVSLLAVTLAW